MKPGFDLVVFVALATLAVDRLVDWAFGIRSNDGLLFGLVYLLLAAASGFAIWWR